MERFSRRLFKISFDYYNTYKYSNKQFDLGDYKWRTYKQTLERIVDLSNGLLSSGKLIFI